MLKTLFSLELKSLFRSPTWKQNLWMRILIVFAILYFVLIFLSLGVGAYYIIEKAQIGEPFEVINRYLIYYIGFDIVDEVYDATHARHQRATPVVSKHQKIDGRTLFDAQDAVLVF